MQTAIPGFQMLPAEVREDGKFSWERGQAIGRFEYFFKKPSFIQTTGLSQSSSLPLLIKEGCLLMILPWVLLFVSKDSETLFLCILVSIPHCFPVWTKQSPICRILMTFWGMYLLYLLSNWHGLSHLILAKALGVWCYMTFPSSDEENKVWKGSAVHGPAGSGRTRSQSWQPWALDCILHHTSLWVEWIGTMGSVSSLFLIKWGNR